MYVVLLGLPGAGKGTQAEFLCRRLGIGHLTTGEMFRDHIRRRTPLGQMAQPYVEGGQLVPDEVTIAMVVEELEGPRCGSGCLLDGFPRTLAQARALDEALARRGKAIDAVIYLRVPEEEVVRRLSGRWTCSQCGAVYHEVNSPPATPGVCDACGAPLYQREDDRPEVVRRRLEVNRRQLEELLDYYRRQGKLREVDGFKSIEEVQAELLEVLMGARRG
ncbi:MAG: adenylate kinase [Dehalococcoidia bacterium]|jgi:adenylate kinase|nr:adenylate kinase [Dehalococcoidia bacterium]